MPKLTNVGTTIKISIYQIIKTGNVRADYSDIEELAASIKKNTLLEPILVKLAEPVDGEARYELIAGHRRVLAHEWLIEHGDDFSMIEAKVITGDKLTIQLIENLQRSDLSARDREKAIYEMSQIPGVKQRDIAAELSKREDYISRQIAAYKVRQIAEEAGLETSALETSVMSEIQTADKKDIPMLVQYIVNGGGTVAAAKNIMKDYRPPQKGKKKTETDFTKTLPPSPFPGAPHTGDSLGDETEVVEVQNRGTTIKADNPEAWKRGEIKHKDVDLNDVFDEIYAYLTALETKIQELGTEGKQAEIESYKREAALDIISLVQKRFEG